MPVEVKFRRGNTSQHSAFTGAEGELTVDTEKNTLIVHDGSTAGGFPVITALAKQSIIPSTNGTFSLGNTTNRWANLFLSGNTLVIGDQTISSNSTGFNLSGTIFVSNTQVLSSSEISVTTGITVGNSTVNSQITSSGITANTITANNLSLTGNLTVSGTTTYINSTTLNIGDNTIVLNADVTNETSPTENAGLEINRGSSSNVSFLWDETGDYWDIGNTTVTGFANISSTLDSGNTTVTGFANVSVSVNSALLSVGTSFIANTTGLFHTGTVNAASISIGNVTFEDSTTQDTAWPGHITQIEGGSAVTVYDVQVAMIDGGHVGVVYAPSDDIFDGGNATSTYTTSTDYKINGGESYDYK